MGWLSPSSLRTWLRSVVDSRSSRSGSRWVLGCVGEFQTGRWVYGAYMEWGFELASGRIGRLRHVNLLEGGWVKNQKGERGVYSSSTPFNSRGSLALLPSCLGLKQSYFKIPNLCLLFLNSLLVFFRLSVLFAWPWGIAARWDEMTYLIGGRLFGFSISGVWSSILETESLSFGIIYILVQSSLSSTNPQLWFCPVYKHSSVAIWQDWGKHLTHNGYP